MGIDDHGQDGSSEYDELLQAVMGTGGNPVESGHSTLGVTVGLIKWPSTSLFPGVPTIAAYGANREEVLRNALRQIRELDAGTDAGNSWSGAVVRRSQSLSCGITMRGRVAVERVDSPQSTNEQYRTEHLDQASARG